MRIRTTWSVLFSVFMLTSAMFAQGWQMQNPSPQGNTLTDIYALSRSTAWAVGDYGTVMRTSDGGSTWRVQYTDPDLYLESVYFANVNSGWAAGYLYSNQSGHYVGRVLQTVDGGETWFAQFEQYDVMFHDITFSAPLIGWVVGSLIEGGGCMYYTMDGGNTWVHLNNTPGYLQSVQFLSEAHGWIAGGAGLLRTTDEGATWVTVPTGLSTPWLNKVQFFDDSNGVALHNYSIASTTNGGNSWTDSLLDWYIQDLSFSDSQNGWAVGIWNRIYRTTDGGDTWTLQDSCADCPSVRHITAADNQNAWAVGQCGNILHTSNSGYNWQTQAGSAIGVVYPGSVSFADSLHGWVTDHNQTTGRLYYTGDGGLSWIVQVVQPRRIHYLYAIDANTAWASSDSGRMMHTLDGGLNWTFLNTGVTWELGRLQFIDDFVGWVVPLNPDWHAALRTTDGGITWTEQDWGAEQPWLRFVFTSATNGWATEGTVLKHTTDGGETWTTADVTFSGYVLGISFVDTNHGWVDNGQHLLRTTDGGETWQSLLMPDSHGGIQMCFTDTLHGYLVKYGDDLAQWTTDGGFSWQSQHLGSLHMMQDMDFSDPNHGWIVGDESIILKWDATPYTAPSPHASMPTAFTLSAYPNPFNPSTLLCFDVPVRSEVQIMVYDLTGRQVQTLSDQVYAPGSYRVSFDGSRLPSGIYFARLQGNSFSKTQKLVLLK